MIFGSTRIIGVRVCLSIRLRFCLGRLDHRLRRFLDFGHTLACFVELEVILASGASAEEGSSTAFGERSGFLDLGKGNEVGKGDSQEQEGEG